jgi:hypothetical protein
MIDTIAINKINKQLKDNFKFIKYDGIVLDTFSEKILKTNNMDVIKTIVYLDGLSKKEIINSFETIVKELETCNEIEDIYKNIIIKKQENSKLAQENYDKLLVKTNKLKLAEEAFVKKLHTLEEQVVIHSKLLDEQKQAKQETFDKDILKFNENILKKQEELELLTNTIDGVFRKEIYEDEFNIPESQFVEKGRLIQLKPDIYSVDNGLLFSKHKNNCFKEFHKYKNKITPLFKYNKLLPLNEYVILVYLVIDKDIIDTSHSGQNGWNICKDLYINKFNISYLTNFGRIINFEYQPSFQPRDGYASQCAIIDGVRTGINEDLFHYKDNKIYSTYTLQVIPDCELQPLPYRMPKLFLTVIEAFQQQNTDMMQECCKKYLDITRESERKTEILTTLQFNKILNEKDALIANKDAAITEHLTIIDLQSIELDKLKVEIAKLKTALQCTLNL